MYYCKNCNTTFETPQKIYEQHGFSSPPYEALYVCPFCSSTDFYIMQKNHCRLCGALLKIGQNQYCSSACRNKGEKLWLRQMQRRNAEYESPINQIIRELENYNKENGIKLSYGQYVSLKFLKGKKKKCTKKKSNT